MSLEHLEKYRTLTLTNREGESVEDKLDRLLEDFKLEATKFKAVIYYYLRRHEALTANENVLHKAFQLISTGFPTIFKGYVWEDLEYGVYSSVLDSMLKSVQPELMHRVQDHYRLSENAHLTRGLLSDEEESTCKRAAERLSEVLKQKEDKDSLGMLDLYRTKTLNEPCLYNQPPRHCESKCSSKDCEGATHPEEVMIACHNFCMQEITYKPLAWCAAKCKNFVNKRCNIWENF